MATTYYPSCTNQRCSLHVEKIGDKKSQAIADAYEGVRDAAFLAAVDRIVGEHIPTSNVRRHAEKHLHLVVEAQEPTGEKVGDIEILDTIIKKGFQHSASWRPTIKDTMDAMAMKLKLGGENPFQDMLDMMDSALDLADETEARDAHGLPDELGDPEEQDAA